MKLNDSDEKHIDNNGYIPIAVDSNHFTLKTLSDLLRSGHHEPRDVWFKDWINIYNNQRSKIQKIPLVKIVANGHIMQYEIHGIDESNITQSPNEIEIQLMKAVSHKRGAEVAQILLDPKNLFSMELRRIICSGDFSKYVKPVFETELQKRIKQKMGSLSDQLIDELEYQIKPVMRDIDQHIETYKRLGKLNIIKGGEPPEERLVVQGVATINREEIQQTADTMIHDIMNDIFNEAATKYITDTVNNGTAPRLYIGNRFVLTVMPIEYNDAGGINTSDTLMDKLVINCFEDGFTYPIGYKYGLQRDEKYIYQRGDNFNEICQMYYFPYDTTEIDPSLKKTLNIKDVPDPTRIPMQSKGPHFSAAISAAKTAVEQGATIKAQSAKLKEQSATIQILKSKIERQKKIIVAQKTFMEFFKHVNAAQRTKITALMSELSKAKGAIDTLKSDAALAQSQITHMNNEIDQKNKIIAQNENTINAHEKTIDQQKKNILVQATNLAKQDRQFEADKAKLTAQLTDQQSISQRAEDMLLAEIERLNDVIKTQIPLSEYETLKHKVIELETEISSLYSDANEQPNKLVEIDMQQIVEDSRATAEQIAKLEHDLLVQRGLTGHAKRNAERLGKELTAAQQSAEQAGMRAEELGTKLTAAQQAVTNAEARAAAETLRANNAESDLAKVINSMNDDITKFVTEFTKYYTADPLTVRPDEYASAVYALRYYPEQFEKQENPIVREVFKRIHEDKSLHNKNTNEILKDVTNKMQTYLNLFNNYKRGNIAKGVEKSLYDSGTKILNSQAKEDEHKKMFGVYNINSKNVNARKTR
jgi:hypothetical protein